MKLTKEQRDILIKVLHSPENIKKRTETLKKKDHFRKAVNARWAKVKEDK